MRICLLTGGGYPFRRDALAGWCRTLVDGLTDHRFALVTLDDREAPAGPAYPLPAHVESARTIALAAEAGREGARRDLADHAVAAAASMCRGLAERRDEDFTRGLAALAALAGSPTGSSAGGSAGSSTGGSAGGSAAPLQAVPLADVLLDAWKAGRAAEGGDRLPRLGPRDARTAVTLLRHAARALSVTLPGADLVHCVGGTTPLLAALATRWRTGIPILLTEARAPVSRPRPHEDRLSPAVQTVLRRFRRAVARSGYAEAGLIAPLSEFHHAWALRHGAEPGRLVPVPAGVDPYGFPAMPESRTPPSIVWAGNGGPASGLRQLLEAFARIIAEVPAAVLHLVGISPAHEDHAAAQIDRAGLGRSIRMHPLPADSRTRYAAGHLVVHVPDPADPPSRLVEAMMSGRAVIGADVGPVAETLGDAGIVVPTDDPETLAGACISLLKAPARRRALGDAARRRALAYFTTERVVRAYGALYTDLGAPPPAPAYELALAVPAPRDAHPATVRWLSDAPQPLPTSGPAVAAAPAGTEARAGAPGAGSRAAAPAGIEADAGDRACQDVR